MSPHRHRIRSEIRLPGRAAHRSRGSRAHLSEISLAADGSSALRRNKRQSPVSLRSLPPVKQRSVNICGLSAGRISPGHPAPWIT